MQFNINSNLISCLILVSLACTLSISMVSCQEKREMSQDLISPFLFNNKRAERISASIDPLSGFSPIGKRDQNSVQDQLKALQKVNDFLREIYGSHDPLPPIRPFGMSYLLRY